MQEKILVIDDYLDSGKSLAWALEAMGHEVLFAESGPDALEKIKKFVPTVVLCDICMPGMMGYDVCSSMKKDYRLKHTLFIAQTAIDTEAGKQKAKESGFEHHMLKPVDINALAILIALHRGKESLRKTA